MNILFESPNYRVSRNSRYITVKLLKPCQTLSTSYVNGGLTSKITQVVNHQCVEGRGHVEVGNRIHELGQNKYHREVCGILNYPVNSTSLLSTAANMANCSVVSHSFKELSVCALVTAGVKGNAGRAGDPATWHEGELEKKPVHKAGTINIILLINWPLSPAALSRALITATEAKSAALWDLYVPSKYSSDLATGTGTDQMAICSPIDPGKKEKHWSGHHSKLGELIGKSVREATLEALRWQNGLEISYTKSLIHALSRYGFSEDSFLENMKACLSSSEFELLQKNKESVLFEPELSASAFALACILDRARQQSLPPAAVGNILSGQCTLMAISLCGKAELFNEFKNKLTWENSPALATVYKAIALGWQNKWT